MTWRTSIFIVPTFPILSGSYTGSSSRQNHVINSVFYKRSEDELLTGKVYIRENEWFHSAGINADSVTSNFFAHFSMIISAIDKFNTINIYNQLKGRRIMVRMKEDLKLLQSRVERINCTSKYSIVILVYRNSNA